MPKPIALSASFLRIINTPLVHCNGHLNFVDDNLSKAAMLLRMWRLSVFRDEMIVNQNI